MNKTGGGVITAKAYITNSTLNFEHNMLDISTVSGIKKHINAGTTVRGSIDFTLYESI